LDPDYVLIHDGARPWISPDLVNAVLENVVLHGACAPVLVPSDAIKQVDSSGLIVTHLRREETVAIQTPQGFRFKEILSAHTQAENDGSRYIDDTEIYERYIHSVSTVPGDPANRKITYNHDLDPKS
jgi:2-C-methyl-D-erythritol 4-phosphate cytidylyltransferase